MAIYDYECYDCGHRIEHVCRMADRPEFIACPKCPGNMRQIILASAIQCDDAVNIPWLQDFARTRKEARFGGRPIQTRKEYKQYLKDKNLYDPHQGENLTEI